MSNQELLKDVQSKKAELGHLYIKLYAGELKNTAEIRRHKKEIARLYTRFNAKES